MGRSGVLGPQGLGPIVIMLITISLWARIAVNTAILNNVRFNTSLLHTVTAVCERGMHVPLQDERLDKGANDDPSSSAVRDVLDAQFVSASSYAA